jgi:hypothetical protein
MGLLAGMGSLRSIKVTRRSTEIRCGWCTCRNKMMHTAQTQSTQKNLRRWIKKRNHTHRKKGGKKLWVVSTSFSRRYWKLFLFYFMVCGGGGLFYMYILAWVAGGTVFFILRLFIDLCVGLFHLCLVL